MKTAGKAVETDKHETDTPPTVRLCFQTAEKAAASIARLMRARYRHKLSDVDFKSLVYGYNQWLAFQKFIKELDIETRLAKLEELNNAKNGV